MEKRLTSYRLMSIALYMQIIYAFFPIIRVLPDSVRAIWRMIPIILVFCAVFLKRNSHLWGVYIVTNLFAALMAFFRGMVYSNGIVESMFMNCINSILYWTCVVEGYYILVFFSKDTVKKILKCLFFAVSITSMTSIIGSLVFPGAIRQTTSFHVEEFRYYKYNIGAYSYVYSIVFLLVIVLFLIKENARFPLFKKSYLYFLFIEIVINIILSQLMTAVAVAAVCSLVLISKRKVKDVCMTLFGIAFFVALMFAPLMSLFRSVLELVKQADLDILYERLFGIYTVLTSGIIFSGNVGARIHLYLTSLVHVKSNPFLGLLGKLDFQRANYYSVSYLLNHAPGELLVVGQHSDIFDLLGGSGLLGITPLVVFIKAFWDKVKKYTCNGLWLKYIFIAIIQYIVYGIFDHAFSCADVALTLFALCVSLGKLKEEKKRLEI